MRFEGSKVEGLGYCMGLHDCKYRCLGCESVSGDSRDPRLLWGVEHARPSTPAHLQYAFCSVSPTLPITKGSKAYMMLMSVVFALDMRAQKLIGHNKETSTPTNL